MFPVIIFFLVVFSSSELKVEPSSTGFLSIDAQKYSQRFNRYFQEKEVSSSVLTTNEQGVVEPYPSENIFIKKMDNGFIQLRLGKNTEIQSEIDEEGKLIEPNRKGTAFRWRPSEKEDMNLNPTLFPHPNEFGFESWSELYLYLKNNGNITKPISFFENKKPYFSPSSTGEHSYTRNADGTWFVQLIDDEKIEFTIKGVLESNMVYGKGNSPVIDVHWKEIFENHSKSIITPESLPSLSNLIISATHTILDINKDDEVLLFDETYIEYKF